MGGRIEAVVADVRDEPGRHVEWHRADGLAGADQEGAGGVDAEYLDAPAGFADAQCVAGHLARGGHPLAQAAGEEGEAVGPGQEGAVGGVFGLPATAGKVVQAGPGRDSLRAGAVFVAAHIVEIGVQARRGVAAGAEPVAEGRGIERAPAWVGGRLDQRHAKEAPPVAAAGVGEAGHFGQKAPVLGGFVGAHVFGGEQAVVPVTAKEQALIGGVHQRRFGKARAGGEGIGFDHLQFGQQFAHGGRFGRGQRQVMGAAGVGECAGRAVEAPAGGVAVGLRAVHEQEVIDAFLRQPPRRGEAGNAAAEDDDAGVDLPGWGG